MTDYADPEDWEREELLAEHMASLDTVPDPDMNWQCRQPCQQCDALRPLRDALRVDGWEVTLETQMGGGVHAVYVSLPDGWYSYLNDEGFSLYDDNRPGVAEYDGEGFAHLSWSTDDPPSPRQQAVLFRLYVAQHRTRKEQQVNPMTNTQEVTR